MFELNFTLVTNLKASQLVTWANYKGIVCTWIIKKIERLNRIYLSFKLQPIFADQQRWKTTSNFAKLPWCLCCRAYRTSTYIM